MQVGDGDGLSSSGYGIGYCSDQGGSMILMGRISENCVGIIWDSYRNKNNVQSDSLPDHSQKHLTLAFYHARVHTIFTHLEVSKKSNVLRQEVSQTLYPSRYLKSFNDASYF